jgi:uncharacterized protein YbjT (DUF2867 family)
MALQLSRRSFAALAVAVVVSRSAHAADSKQIILVAGASGATGRLICDELLAQGYRVRGLTRDTSRAAKANPRVTWVRGDVRDAATLSAAAKGAGIVMCAVGAREPQGDNSPEKVDFEGVRNLIDAAKAAGVAHFILESSCNVTIPEHNFNKIFNGLLLWKMKAEEHLRASGLGFTIVRPPQLLDIPGGVIGIRVQQGDVGGPGQISRADVATVMVTAITEPAMKNTTFEIFGATSLPVNGWRKALSLLKPKCFDRASCGLPPRSA